MAKMIKPDNAKRSDSKANLENNRDNLSQGLKAAGMIIIKLKISFNIGFHNPPRCSQ